MNFKKINYTWSFVGGIIFLLSARVNYHSLFIDPLYSLFVLIFGTFCTAWVIFWFNFLKTNKERNIFLIILILLIPVSFSCAKIGNFLGGIKRLYFCLWPFLLTSPIAGFLLGAKKDIRLRITAVIFVLLCLSAVVLFCSPAFNGGGQWIIIDVLWR